MELSISDRLGRTDAKFASSFSALLIFAVFASAQTGPLKLSLCRQPELVVSSQTVGHRLTARESRLLQMSCELKSRRPLVHSGIKEEKHKKEKKTGQQSDDVCKLQNLAFVIRQTCL